ncbi:MAG TPA: class I SAM-dependent methyltransferase [Vicinamibacterales bacterium]|nr:class I SAM-dependent methyltransferase [Vicinamibacterales bacterium]
MTAFKRTVSEYDLARLKRQREQSDGAYDESLTALDRGIYGLPDFPHSPPLPDETQITPLNQRWEILRVRPRVPSGWRGRIARFVWGLLEPILTEQQAFNATIVDHINRNLPQQRETSRAIETTIAMLRQQIEQLISFHSLLMQYLQRITPFVNSKDYEFAAIARRLAEDAYIAIDSLVRTQRALSSAVQGLSDEMLKHVESLRTRVERYDGRFASVDAALSIVQQQSVTLQRELGRARSGGASAPPSRHHSPQQPPLAGTLAGESVTESWKYPAFEAAFRGSEDDIRERLTTYVPLFESVQDVLDVGCGRGEFLDLLKANGITARGIDLNHEMVEICRARGLEATRDDALGHLRALPDDSIGGLFAAQVVEHLPPDYLLAFLSEAQRVLRRGAPIVLETINVACWLAFFQSYIRDITHARPLHPDTLKYLVVASGFSAVEVQFRAKVDEADRLQKAPDIVLVRPTSMDTEPANSEEKEAIFTLTRTINANFDVLNKLMFTYFDYAVVGKK